MLSPRSIDYWYYQVQNIHLLPIGNVYIFTKSIFSSKIIDFSGKISRRNVVKMDELTQSSAKPQLRHDGNCSYGWLAIEKYGEQQLFDKIIVVSLLFSRTKKRTVGESDEIHTTPTTSVYFPLNSFRNLFSLVTNGYRNATRMISCHNICIILNLLIENTSSADTRSAAKKSIFQRRSPKGSNGLTASIITLKLS